MLVALGSLTASYLEPKIRIGPTGTIHMIYTVYQGTSTYWERYVAHQQGFGGAQIVPGSRYFYDSANENTDNPGEVEQIQFDLWNDTPTVVWRSILPAEIAYPNGPSEARGTLRASIRLTPAVDITNNANPRISYYQRRPDVAIGPTGNVHLTWNQLEVAATQGPDPRNIPRQPPAVYYRNWDASGQAGMLQTVYQEQSAGTVPGGVRIVVDSRNQPKLMFSIGATRNFRPWTGRIPVFTSLTNTADGPMWEEQYPVAFQVLTNWLPMGAPPQTVRIDMGDRLDVAIGTDDQIHMVDSTQYTRTLETALGVRDPHAMVGVFPGGSVNVTNGDLFFQLPLFSTSGAGLNQEVSLVYNSLEGRSGLMAQGWKLNYEMVLIDHQRAVNDPTNTMPDWYYSEDITVLLPDGRWIDFRYASFAEGTAQRCYLVAGNNFDPTAGLMAKLVRSSPGSLLTEYVLTLKNGMVYTFNVQGKLRMIEDAGGNSISFNFTGGRPTSIVDKTSRTTQLEYETNASPIRSPRLNRITDPAGNRYNLKYELPSGSGYSDLARHLTEVEFEGGTPHPRWTFDYGAMNANYERIGLVKRVLPPRGVSSYGWSCKYSDDGRVVAVIDPPDANRALNPNPDDMGNAANPQVVFYYNDRLPWGATPMGDSPYETVVTDRRGIRTRFVCEPRRALAQEIWDQLVLPMGWTPGPLFTNPSPPPGLSPMRFGYDYQSHLLETTNRWGVRTTYEYTSSGMPGHEHVVDLVERVRRWAGMVSPMILAEYGYTTDGLHQVSSVSSPQVMTGRWATVQPTRQTAFAYYPGTSGPGQRGQLQSVTYTDASPPQGQILTPTAVQYQYSGPYGAMSQVTDEEGRVTAYSNFDMAHGLPQRKLSPGCSQYEEFQYDIMGHMTAQRLPQGGQGNSSPDWTNYEYNGLHQLFHVTLPSVSPAENSNNADINSHRTTLYEYDLDGNRTSEQPPAGGIIMTTYNRLGQATGGSGPDGSWSQTVDANGNIRTVVDLRGFTSTRIYDALNRQIEARVPGGSTTAGGGGGTEMVTVNVYDIPFGAVHATDVIHGGSTLSSSGPPVGDIRIIRTMYDEYGRPNQVIGPDPYCSTISYYDELDQVYARDVYGPNTLPGGTVVSAFQRCLRTYRDERGRVIAMAKSGDPQSASQSGANTGTTLTWYDRTGRVIRTRDNAQRDTSYDLDSAGRVQYVRNALNVIVEERIYGDDGLLTETKVPNPATKSTNRATSRKMTYTSRKELWKDLNASDLGLTHQYGRLPGQIDTITNAANVVTKTTYYDTTQRVDEVIEAYGTAVERKTKSIWMNGLLVETRVYNPATGQYNASYAKEYDEAGRLEQVREPQRDDRNLTYNAFGDLVTDDQGILSVTHVPDMRGLPTQSTYVRTGPSGGVSTPVYRSFNGSDQLTAISDPMLTVQMAYADPNFVGGSGNSAWRGVPYRENFQVGVTPWKSQSYGYDASGLQVSMADGEVPLQNNQQAPNHTCMRDANGWVSELRFNNALVMSLEYTPGGLSDVKRIYNSSGNEIARNVCTYDLLGRKATEQTRTAGSNQVLSHIAWEYDDLDRITAKDLRHLGVRQTFQYNDRGELTRDQSSGNSGWGGSGNPAAGLHGVDFVNVIGAQGTGNESAPSGTAQSQLVSSSMSVPSWNRQYVYDPAGNRTSETIDGVSATYSYGSGSRLNQMVRGSVTVSYVYDGLGNLTERVQTEPGVDTIVEEFGYDYMNRLATYENSQTGASWTYQHWPTGDRYEKRNTDAGTAEQYVSCRGDVATEYIDNGSSVDFTNRYVQGLEIDSKATRIPASGGRRHYVSDQVGTTGVTLTDAGAVEEQCVRDAFGRTIAGDTNDERYGFAQREHDMESGLVYMRHRTYDPRIGRFTQVDPILGNRPHEHYVYARNNPVRLTDPMGLDPG